MTEEDEEFNRVEREAKQRMEAVSAALDKKAENARELGLDYEPAQRERDIRNATLDEIAKKIEAMPFGDTAASFAVWIREQKL